MPLNLKIDELLINSMMDACAKGFELGEKKIRCTTVGTLLPSGLGQVTGILGITGRVNGQVIVSMSEKAALRLASSLLQSEVTQIDDDVLDSLAEVTNVVGGRLKSSLASSGYPLDSISLPAVIIGQNYFVSHAKGMTSFYTGYVLEDAKIPLLGDRIVHCAMTLLTSVLKASPK